MDVNPLDRRRTKRVLSTTFICLAFSMCLSTMTRAAVRTRIAPVRWTRRLKPPTGRALSGTRTMRPLMPKRNASDECCW